MTAALPDGGSQLDPSAVRDQLVRILKSRAFRQSQRRQQFLQYLVNETLAGRGDRLKGYTIALEVFHRPGTFDPQIDPLVRIEAARLRDKLREYYDTEGGADPVRIDLPKGGYRPRMEARRDAIPAETISPGDDEGSQPDIVARERPAQGIALAVRNWGPIGFLVAGIVLMAGIWGSKLWDVRPKLPDKPSIAVLPFGNIGEDPKWERFADGITEDIITDLAHSKDLIVIARNSTAIYKDTAIDIRQVGRDLNVKYALEGSIQSLGERIRVTAQLVEATSGSHVWSDRYDRPVDDLFAVQNELTERIAATLIGYQGVVAEAERNQLRRKSPASLTAYDTYLLGLEAKHRVTKESLIDAEDLFRRAIQIDPQFARAYCGLATVQFYLIDLGLLSSVKEAVRRMAEAAERAVQLDPNDGLAHQVLGMAYGYQGKPEQSLYELNRAEILAPSDADLLLSVAWSLPAFGETARAVSLADRSLKLNPRYPDWYNQGLSHVYFFGGQYDRSVKYRLLVKKPVALDYAFLAIAYAYLGRTRDAEDAAARAVKLDPAWNAELYLSEAGGYAGRQAELFVAGARHAGLPDCALPDKLRDMPNFVSVESCNQNRALIAR